MSMSSHAQVLSSPNLEEDASAERQTREDLAALYRLVARYGMSDLIYNHITARVPGSADHFLINSFGLLYEEMTASSLCKVDLDGEIISKPEGSFGINPAGYVIHSAIHAARADVGCVIHTHSRASMAVSAMADGLLPLTQTAMRFYDRVSYHDYEGPAVDLDERRRLVEDLGANEVMLLRNHGTLVTGATIAQAFVNLYYLENACRAQVDILASSRPFVECDPRVARKTQELFESAGQKAGASRASKEWAALLRQLDRSDPSYRD